MMRKRHGYSTETVTRSDRRGSWRSRKIITWAILAAIFAPVAVVLLIGLAAVVMPDSLDHLAQEVAPETASIVDRLGQPMRQARFATSQEKSVIDLGVTLPLTASNAGAGVNQRDGIPTSRRYTDNLVITVLLGVTTLTTATIALLLAVLALRIARAPWQQEPTLFTGGNRRRHILWLHIYGTVSIAFGVIGVTVLICNGGVFRSAELSWHAELHPFSHFLFETGVLFSGCSMALIAGMTSYALSSMEFYRLHWIQRTGQPLMPPPESN